MEEDPILLALGVEVEGEAAAHPDEEADSPAPVDEEMEPEAGDAAEAISRRVLPLRSRESGPDSSGGRWQFWAAC